MSKYTNEELFEKFKSLPKDLQDAILSVDTSEIIREIGEKHKLMIDKIGELADETGLVMLGLTHPNEFISHLAERLEVEHNIAKEIAEEINSKVFFPIRENLKKIHGLAPTLEEVGAPTPPAPIEVPEPALPTDKVVGTPTEASGPTAQPTTPTEPLSPTPPTVPSEDVGKITTPPVIMSMPIDLTKAQKPEAETETPAAKKVDPYKEQLP